MNQKTSFSDFILGDENRAAYDAVQMVLSEAGNRQTAESPCPLLYIHGKSGVGKTHLMQLAFQKMQNDYSDISALYCTGEDFRNDFYEALSLDESGAEKLRKRYQSYDVLLMDDISCLESADLVQKELLRLINIYKNKSKHIILSSPYPVQSLSFMEYGRSVLSSGHKIEMAVPGYKTRLEILKKLSDKSKQMIDQEVLCYIASHADNLFILQGAWEKVLETSRLQRQDIKLSFARDYLKGFLTDNPEGYDYIRSESVKKYLKDKGIRLDDKLKYALIMNNAHDYPWNEVRWSLRKLIRETDDAEVKFQAEKRIQDTDQEYERFGEIHGKFYFYRLSVYDKKYREYDVIGNFRTLDHAEYVGRIHALDEYRSFKIDLEYINGKDKKGFYPDEVDRDQTCGGTAFYDSCGEFLYCNYWDIEKKAEDLEDPIENRWFPFPHPFRKGDILRACDFAWSDDMRFIVTSCDGQDEIAEQYSHHQWRFNEGLRATWDMVTFEVIPINIKTGIVWDQDDPLYPYDFEYADVSEDYINTPDQMLIQMSKMVKGKPFSMQYIQNAQLKLHEDYDYNERYQLITGLKLKKSTIGTI